VNGVTYTVKTWRERWAGRGSHMDVVYPRSDHVTSAGEHPVSSLPFPFYDGFRVGVPQIPEAVSQADVVHAHTPFSLGVGGYRLSRRLDVPLVASYHTPISEYASYISFNGAVEKAVRCSASRYERWFLDRADLIVAPSERTAEARPRERRRRDARRGGGQRRRRRVLQPRRDRLVPGALRPARGPAHWGTPAATATRSVSTTSSTPSTDST